MTEEQLRREILLGIRTFLVERNILRQKLEITKVLTKEEDEKIQIDIYLVSPGLLIGKGGEIVKSLVGFLTRTLDQKVFIEIHEDNFWES